MATLDLTKAKDRVRLNIGDTSDIPWLADSTIEYSLTYNSNNENAATKQCAQFILAQMSYQGHERLDKLEFWGDTVFTQYRTFLKDIVNNPVFSGTAGVYVGGMELADVQANILDTTLVQKRIINYPKDIYDDSDEMLYGVSPVENSDYF